MKNIILFSLLLSFCSCDTNSDCNDIFDYTGVIIGQDSQNCDCCGNCMIKIDQLGDTLLFVSLPETSEISLTDITLPFKVELNWAEDTSKGCLDHISIDCIRQRG